ncbi:MAG: hypothetical protein RJB14_3544 [Pseudomonadota bacterium]
METVSVKPSYREPWKHRQFGLVLVDRFCEPHYGLGKPVRWQIGLESEEPFGIACLWETRIWPKIKRQSCHSPCSRSTPTSTR